MPCYVGGECPLVPIGEQSSSSPSSTGFVLGEEPASARGQGVADASQINPHTKRHCVTEWDSSVAL